MKRIEEILAQCVDDIKSGKASLSDCLGRYPSIRQELEPLLKIALGIKEPPDIKPSDAFKVRARVNLMEHIHASQSAKRSSGTISKAGARQVWYAAWLKPVAIAIVAILIISALGTGTAYASQDSLPGDTLYAAKLGTEQLQRVLTFNGAAEVDLELKFANTRLGEIAAIANKRMDKIAVAINGYERNLNLAISEAERAGDSGTSLETVALAISNHLSRLDEIEDSVPEAAIESISSAEEIAINGHFRALRSLAEENPVRATEINIEAMQGRLNRAKVASEIGNGRGVEEALQQFERLRRFGEEISSSAGMRGQDTRAIDEMNALATNGYLKTLGSIYGQVSQETKGAVEQAMGVAVEEHRQAVQGLQQQGIQSDIPAEPPLPNEIPDDVKKNIQESGSKGSGNGRK